STVAGMFAELGATVIDADREGHAVLAPGEPALAEVVAHFGGDVLRSDGTLDRPRLAEQVFGSPPELRRLNRITHPRIAQRIRARLEALQQHPPDPPIILLEAALLVEAGWQALVDKTLVITAQPSTQTGRLIAGPGLSRAQAEARIRAQFPMSRKLRVADYRLSGEIPLAETRRQVLPLWREWLDLVSQTEPRRRTAPVPLRV
ncbi:MAG TPA: dephospho-CoA kinase, partial [Armatimonadota bacterium]|nr:dephospho-CoA kinase [Armatimonadota bacterium]